MNIQDDNYQSFNDLTPIGLLKQKHKTSAIMDIQKNDDDHDKEEK